MFRYSVIVPVYQVRDYIEDCLNMLFSQMNDSVQVILVDDGSTDGSGEICCRYAQGNPNIVVIHQENRGVAAARNAGLRAAKGEYLLWIDPDDLVTENWLEEIDREIQASHPDILVFDYLENRNGNITKKHYGRTSGLVDQVLFLRDVSRDIRIKSSLWDKAIRRDLFDGLAFDERIRCLEDYDLLHRVIMRAEKIYYLPKVLYEYQIRTDGLVRTMNLDVSYQSFLIAQKRKREIEAIGTECDVLGVALQAREFCRNYHLACCKDVYRSQYRTCVSLLRTSLPVLLADKEVSWKTRISACAFCIPGLCGIFAVITNR